jgi:MSHA pilin protein MshD
MTRRTPRARLRAFTMVEVAMSTIVVGVMLGAAIETVGASRTGQVWNSDRLRALALAQALMGEITDSYYQDPSALPTAFGPDVGENQAVRTTLNDVDDFNGITGAPTNRDGTAIPNLSGWTRTVAVAWVTYGNLAQTSVTPTVAKRVTVSVYRGSVKMAELVAVRCQVVAR